MPSLRPILLVASVPVASGGFTALQDDRRKAGVTRAGGERAASPDDVRPIPPSAIDPAGGRTGRSFLSVACADDRQDGRRHGRRRATHIACGIDEGTFRNDLRDGAGTCTTAEGSGNRGKRRSGQTGGQGIAIYPDGIRLHGALRNGQFVG